MAELGDFSTLMSEAGSAAPKDISVDMLDYAYVETCSDTDMLQGILAKLKSHEYGSYPELEKKAEGKLLSLLPKADVDRMTRLRHVTTAAEIADATSVLQGWEESVRRKDAAIEAVTAAAGNTSGNLVTSDIFTQVPLRSVPRQQHSLPPVRGSGASSSSSKVFKSSSSSSKTPSSPGEAESKESREARLSGYDFPAWEKYDVEGEEARLEAEMVADNDAMLAALKPSASAEDLRKAASAKRSAAHSKEMEGLQRSLGTAGLTMLQRSTRGNREKIKGNECFRIGEVQEAFDCYSRSLALDRTNPITYANRAMSAIRLELFELAEDDCSRSLRLDPTYVKAWSRRGMTRFKRGNYKGACEDFDAGLKLDPGNVDLAKLWETAKAKYVEVEGRSLPYRDTSDAGSVSLVSVRNIGDLPIPPRAAVQLAHGTCTATRPLSTEEATATDFTRITIADDSDSSSDEEEGDKKEELKQEEVTAASKKKAGFTKIAVVEESDSESDEAVSASPEVIVEEQIVNDERAHAFKDEGNRHMKAGEHREAVFAYTQSLNLAPQLLASLNNRAMAHLAMQAYNNVVADTTAVLDVEAGNSKALYRRGVAHLRLGYHVAAQADIDALLAVEPSNAQALGVQADIASAIAAAGSPSEQEQTKQKTVSAIVPTAVDMTNAKKLALRAMDEGDNAGAVRVLEAALRSTYFAIATNAENIEVKVAMLHLLHTAQLRDGNPEAAQEALERVLKVQPNNFKAVLKVAEVLKQLDRMEKAAEFARLALEIDPAHTGAQELLKSVSVTSEDRAATLKAQGNAAMMDQCYTEAIELYTRAINISSSETTTSSSMISINNRAQAYLKLGRYNEAIEDACVVISALRDSGNIGSSVVYRKALFRRGFCLREKVPADTVAALADFEELLGLEPDNKGFQQEYARTQARQLPMPPAPVREIGDVNIGLTASTTVRRTRIAVVEEDEEGNGELHGDLPSPPSAAAAAVGSKEASVDAAFHAAAAAEKNSSEQRAAKATAKAKVVSPLKRPSVPSEPPRTVYELEKVWRALKSYPDLFAQYLSVFKKGTYKKVFKDSIDGAVLSSVFVALRDHADTAACVQALTGLSGIAGFDMTLSLLPEADLAVLADVFQKLEVLALQTDKVAELKVKFNV